MFEEQLDWSSIFSTNRLKAFLSGAMLLSGFITSLYGFWRLSTIGSIQPCQGSILEESSRSANTIDCQEASTSSAYINVYVAGAIKKPGVYQLMQGDLIADAIKVAGGVSTLANESFLNKELNLAQKINDQEQIYIPFDGENYSGIETLENKVSEKGTSSSNEDLSTNNTSSISINNATASELETLSGIGEKRAEGIIQNRPFSSIAELVSKEIISESLFQEIKDQISL